MCIRDRHKFFDNTLFQFVVGDLALQSDTSYQCEENQYFLFQFLQPALSTLSPDLHTSKHPHFRHSSIPTKFLVALTLHNPTLL